MTAAELKAQRWVSIIMECKTSGQSVPQWCNEHGINEKQYWYYRRKLRNHLAQEVGNHTDIFPATLPPSSDVTFQELKKPIQESDVAKNRKKQWLLDSLHENCKDASKSRKLIDVVVNVMPHWKMDYILEYLKDNQNIEDFKKIHLFPMSASWSGSEIPLIMDKIEFLLILKEKLKGVAYIEHRAYIDEYRRDLEEYKRKVELREYLEEADYA
jgi:hypothetical protein